ncbi:MAG: hypothetical protein Q9201_007952, partial [Fulgogasparrea decipioides]
LVDTGWRLNNENGYTSGDDLVKWTYSDGEISSKDSVDWSNADPLQYHLPIKSDYMRASKMQYIASEKEKIKL